MSKRSALFVILLWAALGVAATALPAAPHIVDATYITTATLLSSISCWPNSSPSTGWPFF